MSKMSQGKIEEKKEDKELSAEDKISIEDISAVESNSLKKVFELLMRKN